jgi:hypothetical protein
MWCCYQKTSTIKRPGSRQQNLAKVKAAGKGQVEILERLWDFAKELQLKPDEFLNEVLLSKDKFNRTAWHMAAEDCQFLILEKLWDFLKELQLKPQGLRNDE